MIVLGKTGSVEWIQVKGRKGRIRLVPKSRAATKRPGPGQRYDSAGSVRRKIARSEKAVIGPKNK